MYFLLYRAIFHTILSGVSSIITELCVFRGEIEPEEIIERTRIEGV